MNVRGIMAMIVGFGFLAGTVWAETEELPAEGEEVEIVREAGGEELSSTVAIEGEEESDEQEVEVEVVEVERKEPSGPTFVVIMPERIDHAWYWIMYSDRAQHLVQSAIEKALVRAGAEVIDLSTANLPHVSNDWNQLMSVAYGLRVGRELKADYLITGQATAVKAGEGHAYGVNVARSQAHVAAKIVRVSDGKILAIEDESALVGGQSVQAAGQAALKKAGGQIAARLARHARSLIATGSVAP